jgi:hypothetical protein
MILVILHDGASSWVVLLKSNWYRIDLLKTPAQNLPMCSFVGIPLFLGTTETFDEESSDVDAALGIVTTSTA